ncbi:MAG: acyl-CoA dehydrogenase family protein [Proteobacteria bacterium]|nr:acyl-CoA dehydrogenase family protein [Pseudomonadota bacterium]MBU1584522.1 acyl-CoA dehydrogenase family protein [Pseudomonadota bacterium]MBU2451715.1 acyl-CoA dehydrogenase family protein [Pseudomonadota bacterium]MBU2631544.1 acyl-CoA dehydrogenase family protein [Pseudomonadota bacterium]
MKEKGRHYNQQAEIIGLTKKIAKEQIVPQASECDRKGTFPWEAIRAIGEVELPALVISEKEGGMGEGRGLFASVVQELAKVCASTALIYTSHVVLAKAIEISGSDDLKKEWLPYLSRCKALGAVAVHEQTAGSNAGAISTRAIKDGDAYIVNGSKFFITSGGEATAYLVLVRTDPEKGLDGMSTLLIVKNTPGLSFGQAEEKMGLRSTASREMFLNDCRVPAKNLIGAEGEGLKVIGQSLIGWGFYGAAAISSGIAKASLDKAVRHARERTIAGQPIGVHQGVQFLISDMILGCETIEAYLNTCAAAADAIPSTMALNGFKAKLYASEVAIEVANKAIQVMGGHGYCQDYSVERFFRDARGLTLHFKTSEWLKQDIAKAALKL